MGKYFLDTNIIMEDPFIVNKIHDSEIYIHPVVLQELDNNKSNERVGMNVRTFTRLLDKLYENDYITESNSKIYFPTETIYNKLIMDRLGGEYTNDDKIIHSTYMNNANLLSNDALVRIKFRSLVGPDSELEVTSLTSELNESNSEEFYKGYIEHYLPDNLVDTLYKLKYLSIEYFQEIKPYPHMFIIINRFSGKSGSIIGKVNNNCTCIELIEQIDNVWGISPKNVQQLMALHLLLDTDIPLVTMIGNAGTGKTLLSMAAGLLQTQDESTYKKLVATKPIIDMGKELGTLPGDKEAKLNPYVESYYDALEFIFGGDRDKMYDALNGMQNNFQVDALNYIRGRSLPGQYFVVDEAQNLTRHEIKTIVTRMGEGSKVILMGDPGQIDNRWLDRYNNGLIYIMEKFKDQPLGAHITFEKGVRSGLASVAAEIL